jgi:serine-type D-Ala-D-Ala carboxypeptidase (penicillin-binding protein 5/6)
VRVWGGETRWVDLVTTKSFKVALSSLEQSTVEVKLDYTGPMLAPVKAGTTVGKVRIVVDGKTIADIDVVTSTSIGAVDSIWRKSLDSLLMMTFGG